MAVYKVSDLCKQLDRITNDGYEYVDLELLDGDIDFPEKLSFIAIKSPSSSIDYGVISSSSAAPKACCSCKKSILI